LPPLPRQVEIATDAREGRGPLQGIAAGVAAIGDRATVVYVSGVDAPLLHPAFVRHVVRSLRAGDDVALPRAHGFAQPLAAAYRTAALEPRLHELIARERLGTRDLFEQLAVRELDEAALLDDPDVAALDPELASLLNLNEPGEYKAARARPAPSIAVRAAGERAARAVQAATLQAAADAAGLTLTGAGIAASLDGHGDVGDPQEPLVTGDAVTFHAQGS
jgi:molybdopterin-guanine dinucleotide biosynthesis protein A